MYTKILITGDASVWTLSQPIDEQTLTTATGPLSLDVTAPIAGTMVLSPATAHGIILLPAGSVGGGATGWIPGDPHLLLPQLYLPSAVISKPGPGPYPLPADTDLPALVAQIAAAMSAGTRLAVKYGATQQDGVVVLNGATLPFAVVTQQMPTIND